MVVPSKYITNEYKTLLPNVTLVLYIVLLTVLCIDIVLTAIAPNWIMKLCLLSDVFAIVASAWLLFKAIQRMTEQRDQLVIVEWIASYMFLLIGTLPIVLFIYLNLDWLLLAEYGTMVLSAYWSVENMVLPVVFLLLVNLIFWTLTIQLYKKSYIIFLCLNKKKEIYG